MYVCVVKKILKNKERNKHKKVAVCVCVWGEVAIVILYPSLRLVFKHE